MTLKPLISRSENQNGLDNGAPVNGTNTTQVSMINLYPPRQVLGTTTEPSVIVKHQNDALSRNEDLARQNATSDDTQLTGTKPISHNFGCLQNLFGDSFDGRSQHTQAKDITGAIGYQTVLPQSKQGL